MSNPPNYNWLVCGSRKPGYREQVLEELDLLCELSGSRPDSIIEGCCPDSADVWAEEWAEANDVPIQHHPATSGNYLKRNIEMVEKAGYVIAFWDQFSYGTAHTIAHAILKGIRVNICLIEKKDVPQIPDDKIITNVLEEKND